MKQWIHMPINLEQWKQKLTTNFYTYIYSPPRMALAAPFLSSSASFSFSFQLSYAWSSVFSSCRHIGQELCSSYHVKKKFKSKLKVNFLHVRILNNSLNYVHSSSEKFEQGQSQVSFLEVGYQGSNWTHHIQVVHSLYSKITRKH